MFAISNAMLFQADIVQRDRWDQGPLELVFFDSNVAGMRHAEMIGMVADWNRTYEGGLLRGGNFTDELQNRVSGLSSTRSPTVFVVPTRNNWSALNTMLASIVPECILARHGLTKESANMWLLPIRKGERNESTYGARSEAAFQEYIWSFLCRSSRCRFEFFSQHSPIRILAGDTRYWMSRLYRVALARYECMPVTQHIDDKWTPMEDIELEFLKSIPEGLDKEKFFIRRPRMGGELWDPDNPDECEAVTEEMVNGCGIMDNIEQIVDVIHSHPAHEDFSERYSWIKEDFERSFYSKRSRVKVTLTETVDDFPVWEHSCPDGYDNILFRDILAVFNRKEQELLIALRHGKTVTDISAERGHKSHSSISRTLDTVKSRVRKLLE